MEGAPGLLVQISSLWQPRCHHRAPDWSGHLRHEPESAPPQPWLKPLSSGGKETHSSLRAPSPPEHRSPLLKNSAQTLQPLCCQVPLRLGLWSQQQSLEVPLFSWGGQHHPGARLSLPPVWGWLPPPGMGSSGKTGLGEKQASWEWGWIKGQAEPSGLGGARPCYIPLPLSERCGWLLTALGTPWVAQRVCAMPKWVSNSTFKSMLSCSRSRESKR